MPYLLNCCYFLLLLVVSPLILYRMLLQGKYREGMGERFTGKIASPSEKKGRRLWFQAVSVGEVNLLRPILRDIASLYPDWEIVISSTSKTGFELAQRLFPDHYVFRCPLDFSWAVRRVVKTINPDMLVLTELELWPNLVMAVKRAGAQCVIVNGRISDGSMKRYLRVRPALAGIFRKLDFVMSGSAESDTRFAQLGVPDERRRMTGSIKFDGVQTDPHNPRTESLRHLAQIPDGAPVFLAGSTQDPEEAMALETYRTLIPDHPQLRLILVPRHPERFDDVAALLTDSGLAYTRRTALDSASNQENKNQENLNPTAPILLVDTVGELGAWWGTATAAFVGGSMGSRGGQNMLEPAAYGAAVCFGPNTKNFREISERMLQAEAAQVVTNQEEMTEFVRRVLDDSAFAKQLGNAARSLVLAQQGATRTTVLQLAQLLDSPCRE